MKDRNLYVHAHVREINIRRLEGKPIDIPNVRYKDIPKEYRRPRSEFVLKGILCLAFILFTINCVLFFATVL